MARRLQGGYAEWMEFSEPVEAPTEVPGAAHQLGDPVKLTDGRQAVVHTVTPDGFLVWVDEHVEGPLSADALAG